MKKTFKLSAEAIRPLATGYGACIASDRITVDGCIVGYMYRELPDDGPDGGWRFLAGDESQEYADEAAHFGLYDVNTIANYDPTIIEHLDAPPGSAFERQPSGQLVLVED